MKSNRSLISGSREPFLASNVRLNEVWVQCSPWDQRHVFTSTILIQDQSRITSGKKARWKGRPYAIPSPGRDVFVHTGSLSLFLPQHPGGRKASRAGVSGACVSSDVTQPGPSSTPAWSMNVSDCSCSRVDTETPRPYLLQFASKMLPTATRMSFFKNLFKEVRIVLLIPT